MNPPDSKEETIFSAARQLADEGARAAYLDQACQGEPQLRQRIERLLQAGEQARPFFQQNAATLLAPASADPRSETPGSLIGRYKLLQKIGEGGCGVVYMAEQEEPVRRRVALKVIKLGMDTRQVVARFEAERQALAMMDHPNIAKVLDAGATETGRPYFVMELVRGIPITKYCDENRLSTRERLDLFVKICQAVQHAHQKGIIHRDIKPSNILVTLHDGVPVPKVIDFGIAKATEGRLTDHTLFTAFEQFLGTPAYMSPEQAEMSGLDIDTRSDIYSLGVLLYELLTSKTPFDVQELLALGLDEMRRAIREIEPERPSTRLSTMLNGELTSTARNRHSEVPKLVNLIRGDLDWIVMKCLEKDRTRRYETANGLARDIERHLANEPIVARPPSAAYRARKFIRRNQWMVAAAGTVALALVLGTVVSAWQAVRATRARQQAVEAERKEARQHRLAEAARDQAQQARQDALRNLYIAHLNLVQQDYEQGNLARVHRSLTETQNSPHRGFEWFYWQRRIHQDLRTLRGHRSALRDVAISPDGRLVATASTDGTATLWEADTGQVRQRFTFQGESRAAAFSLDGRQLAVSGGNSVIIWDIPGQRRVLSLTDTNLEIISALALSPDRRQLVTAGFSTNLITVWDLATQSRWRVLREPATNVSLRAVFSPDGSKILTSSFGDIAFLWDAASGQLLPPRFDGQAGSIWDANFSSDGRRVVTAHFGDGVARVWDTMTGVLLLKLAGHTDALYGAAFSPDGRRIYTSGWDQQIKSWDAQTGRQLAPLPKGQTKAIISMALSAGGRRLVTGNWDGEATLWATDRSDGPRTFEARLWPNQERALAAFWASLRGPTPFLASDSRNGLILAPDPQRNIRVWDFATHQERFTLQQAHSAAVSALAVSPDQQHIVTGDEQGSVRVWNAANGQPLYSLDGHTNKIRLLGFSSNGRRLMVAGQDGLITVWDNFHQPALRWARPGAILWAAAISPDGGQVAAGYEDGSAIIWDTVTRRPRRTLSHAPTVKSLAWSPDGQYVATGGWNTMVRIWEVATGNLAAECQGHTYPAWCLAFSPDGARLVTGSMDKTARIWEVASGRELLSLKGHVDDIHAVAFSPDGQRVVTGSDDQTVKVWEAATEESVAAWQKEEAEATLRIESLRNTPAQPSLPAPSEENSP